MHAQPDLISFITLKHIMSSQERFCKEITPVVGVKTPVLSYKSTVMTLSFRTDRSGQTVQTQIRLLLEEQSDQGLHCLQFHLHLFDEIP